MTLSDLQTLIGSLVNDPNHDRYTTTDLGTELDNSMDEWNVEARIIKNTVTLTVVAGTRQYALSSLTGTPIAFTRATHKGLPLKKRSRAYFDLYSSGQDWTTIQGTPTDYCIEEAIAATQYVTIRPTPTGNDTGANLVVEYVARHTSMSAASDTPFMTGTTVNYLLRPYDWGLAYHASARLLARDPSEQNNLKTTNYATIAKGVKADVIQVLQAMEKEEPYSLRSNRLGVRRRSLRTT